MIDGTYWSTQSAIPSHIWVEVNLPFFVIPLRLTRTNPVCFYTLYYIQKSKPNPENVRISYVIMYVILYVILNVIMCVIMYIILYVILYVIMYVVMYVILYIILYVIMYVIIYVILYAKMR